MFLEGRWAGSIGVPAYQHLDHLRDLSRRKSKQWQKKEKDFKELVIGSAKLVIERSHKIWRKKITDRHTKTIIRASSPFPSFFHLYEAKRLCTVWSGHFFGKETLDYNYTLSLLSLICLLTNQMKSVIIVYRRLVHIIYRRLVHII